MIDISNINLNLLVVFDVLMREQNLTKTGEQLGLSQPTISHALKGLREMFNDELFIKSAGGMRPTKQALHLIEPLRCALAKIEGTLHLENIFDPMKSQRIFQLGLSDYANFIFLPLMVAQLAREAPNIALDVQHINKPEKSQMIENGDLEMAIALFDKAPQRLQYQELFTEKLVCIAAKNHPELQQGLTLEKFISIPHISISFSEESTATVQQILSSHGLKRHIALKVRHVVPAGYVVKNSSLIAVLPERLGIFLEKMIAIQVHEIPLELEPQTVSLIWHKRGNTDPGLVWLRQHIVELAEKLRRREFKDIPYNDLVSLMLERAVIKNDEADPEQ